MQNKLLEEKFESNSKVYIELQDDASNKKAKKKFLVGSEDEEDKSTRQSMVTIASNEVVEVAEVEQPVPLKKENSQGQLSSSSKKKKKAAKAKGLKSSSKRKSTKYKHRPFKWSTYRFLLKYPMRHWKLSVFTNILIIATSILGVYLPWIMGRLLDSTTQHNDEKQHRELSITFLEVMLVLAFLQFFRSFSNQIWQEQIYCDMRHDVLDQFLKFDLPFFQRYRTGEIISRMTSDLQSAKSAVSGNIIVFLRNVISSLSNVIVLFLLSSKLTLAVLSTMPPFVLITMVHTRLAKSYEKITQQYQADVTSVSDEIVSGIVTVKSFCAEEKEMARFDRNLAQFLVLSYRKGINNAFYQSASTLFIQLGTLIVLWYGGKLVLEDDELSPGELASFIFYSVQLSNSSSTISETYSKIVSATGSFEGVLEMLRYQNLVNEATDAIDPPSVTGEIEFQSVYFQYPGTSTTVLKNFNLRIVEGEYVAFVGMSAFSGSGKSTIVKLIERFYDPQRGSVNLGGTDIRKLRVKGLRRLIGLVSQEPALFEGTIESNITYGVQSLYTQEDLEWASKASGSWSFIQNRTLFPKGLKTYVGEGGSTLSGGQKQRIAIARALIKRPKILIFDEATSALDAQSESLVQMSIDELVQSKMSITIIVIAHRLSTIMNCNRIVVLENGEVCEMGSHAELMDKNGVYKSLVEKQIQGIVTDENDN